MKKFILNSAILLWICKITQRSRTIAGIWVYLFSYSLQLPCACRWVLLEALDQVSPGIVNWKIASKPPIKMPFRKVENCNQVVKIGKQLKFSLVNIAGNDIVQGNKKLILGMCFSTLTSGGLVFDTLNKSFHQMKFNRSLLVLLTTKIFKLF